MKIKFIFLTECLFFSLTDSLTSCDFELGFCTWIQDHTDDFDWTRDKGKTSSSSTGPSFDHTTQTARGYYIYIEATENNPEEAARIISCPLASTGSICVSFWYHMYGVHVNTLNVYQQEINGSMPLLWTKIGNQGNSWMYGDVEVSVHAGDQVRIYMIDGMIISLHPYIRSIFASFLVNF